MLFFSPELAVVTVTIGIPGFVANVKLTTIAGTSRKPEPPSDGMLKSHDPQWVADCESACETNAAAIRQSFRDTAKANPTRANEATAQASFSKALSTWAGVDPKSAADQIAADLKNVTAKSPAAK